MQQCSHLHFASDYGSLIKLHPKISLPMMLLCSVKTRLWNVNGFHEGRTLSWPIEFCHYKKTLNRLEIQSIRPGDSVRRLIYTVDCTTKWIIYISFQSMGN